MPTLPTAFVGLQGAKIRLDGGTLVVEHAAHSSQHIPIGHIGALITLGAVECTTAAQSALAARRVGCVHASRSGFIKAVVTPWNACGFALRQAQHALEIDRQARGSAGAAATAITSPNPGAAHPGASPSLAIARSIIHAKLDAIIALLAQHERTHADVGLSRTIALIRALRERLELTTSIDQLRGFEGAATAHYFAVMPVLCRGELTTTKRTRRPPQDALNAALSFGYTLLTSEMHAIIVARGLEPCLGLLHPAAGNRPSLALDLIEPLRHAIIDRLVLRAANRRELVADDFETVHFQADDSEVGYLPNGNFETSKFDAANCATVPIDRVRPSDGRASAGLEKIEGPEGLAGASEDDSISPPFSHDRTEGGSPTAHHSPAKAPRAAQHGVRCTDQGRRKFLLLYSEAMEASLRTANGASRSVRSLLSDAVESYEKQLRATAPSATRLDAAGPTVESEEP